MLPFDDKIPNRDQEYLSDGITEELINALSQIEALRVVARTSAFMFKGKIEDVRRMGEQLNVRNVLEGSVLKADDKMRMTAQLINAAAGYILWSEKYDVQTKEVFAVQDEISGKLVDTLKIKLTSDGKTALVKPATENSEAYDPYQVVPF